MNFDQIRMLRNGSESKVVLLVLDGLGGLPISRQGVRATELEAALTPHLDGLAEKGICGLHEPVAPGITPGSGPAHLALFGYDPLRYEVGRGVLSALGIDFDLRDGDVAARGNFCTVDEAGRVTDRRAGRIDSGTNRELCDRLREIEIEGVEIFVETVKEYRFLLVLRGDDLSAAIADTDPQAVGVTPRDAEAREPEGNDTAAIVSRWLEQARRVLADQEPANMVLLRGFSTRPSWPQLPSIYGVRAAAVAAYPMYRGVAALVGMEVLETGDGIDGELAVVSERWDDFDFFFVHVKKTDSAGEDGDFARKVELIEEVDRAVPMLRELEPDVLVVTGDHSTPSTMRSHSWHPVPVLLQASTCRPDRVDQFSETACLRGGLGVRFPASSLLRLAFAHAGRLGKFGA